MKEIEVPVPSVDIHCSCPPSLSHALTLPTPSLISPITGFSFVCVGVRVIRPTPLISPSHSCSSVVHSSTSFSYTVLFLCMTILLSGQQGDIIILQGFFSIQLTFLFCHFKMHEVSYLKIFFGFYFLFYKKKQKTQNEAGTNSWLENRNKPWNWENLITENAANAGTYNS